MRNQTCGGGRLMVSRDGRGAGPRRRRLPLVASADGGVKFDSLTALIAPHAGLIYSGPVAAYAYRLLPGRTFDVIVLVGPSHFVGFDGVAVYRAGGFQTPLGVAPIDVRCAVEIMSAAPIVREHDAAHAREHSLEMQLPFLQRLAPGVPIVPLVMGFQSADTARALGGALAAVSAAAARSWSRARTSRTITMP